MENKNSKIVLVPTDFSEVADFAIDQASSIARQLNGKVLLLHVINKDTKTLLKKEKLGQDAIDIKLKKVTERASEMYNVKLDYLAKEGSIFTTIGEVSKEVNASIVVMGTHGKVGLQHLLGSHALKVIESSPVPVIVVQSRDLIPGYQDIVLPIDETPESKQKVNWAIHIAKLFNSTIHLFGVHHNDEFLMNEVSRNIAQIRSILSKNDILFTEKIAPKSGSGFAKEILIYADSIKADIIMIMTNPDKLLPSFIISPWAEQVIYNTSKISVLCINPVELEIMYVSF